MDKNILSVLVGSRAHGLSLPDSDYDYRGVFVLPTRDIWGLGAKPSTISWKEGEEDDTKWEVGHFLNLAIKSNPSILEVFVSPVETSTKLGEELLALFPHLWSSTGVRDAFLGYSKNQRKKFLEEDSDRVWKYAVAYIRVLLMGIELLETGNMSVQLEPDNKIDLMAIKQGGWSKGDIINWATSLEARFAEAYKANPNKQTDLKEANEFLLKVRRIY